MSAEATVTERLAQRVPLEPVSQVCCGSPARYRLAPASLTTSPNTVKGAEALVKRRLTMRQAHKVMTCVLAGESVVVDLPMVEDRAALEGELARFGILAVRHETPETGEPMTLFA